MKEALVTAKKETSEGQLSLTELLDQMEARANAAALGPWSIQSKLSPSENHKGFFALDAQGYRFLEIIPFDETGRPGGDTADFIAAARSDVPALVKALRFYREEIACYLPDATLLWLDRQTAQLLSEQTRRAADSAPDATKSSPASD